MPKIDEDVREAALYDARVKLHAAIVITPRRALTAAEVREFQKLEKLVAGLAAKLGRDRIQRPPTGPRRPPAAAPTQPPKRRLIAGERITQRGDWVPKHNG